jgi:hypothetical protein
MPVDWPDFNDLWDYNDPLARRVSFATCFQPLKRPQIRPTAYSR